MLFDVVGCSKCCLSIHIIALFYFLFIFLFVSELLLRSFLEFVLVTLIYVWSLNILLFLLLFSCLFRFIYYFFDSNITSADDDDDEVGDLLLFVLFISASTLFTSSFMCPRSIKASFAVKDRSTKWDLI